MRKLFKALVVVVAAAAVGGRAQAWQWGHQGVYPQTAAFPLANPPGWYTNTYYFAWQYPWFAYYNYSHGPYANWTVGGGFATYTTYTGHPVMYRPWVNVATPAPEPAPKDKVDPKDKKPEDKKPAAGKVTVNLPADAKLLFNGTPAAGTGGVRTFTTPELQPGADYGYELTAEVVRDGKTERVTGLAVVRAGQTTTITLVPDAIRTAAR